MSSKQFKPKNPKARKQKSTAQKRAIAQRQRAEDSRQDAVAEQRKRSFALQKDPRQFLTGLPPQAQAEVSRAYGRVLAYNDKKAQDDLADSFGGMELDTGAPAPTTAPTPASSPAPAEARPEVDMGGIDDITSGMAQMNTTQKFPPGVKLRGKNLTSEMRRHNKDVRRQDKARWGYLTEMDYPGNALPDQDYNLVIADRDRAESEKREERKRGGYVNKKTRTQSQYLSKYEQLLARGKNRDVQDYLAKEPMLTDIDPNNPFAPTPQSIAQVEGTLGKPDLPPSGPGDYLYELEKEQEGARALAEVRAFEDSQYNIEERQRNAVPELPSREDVVVRMDAEDVDELRAQAKDLLARKKGAKSQEEKDYYKRALADLKDTDASAVKSRQRQRQERAEQSAPTSFIPQRPGVSKYPGPANIQDGFVSVSREIGARALTDLEEQSYKGGGTTGQTQRFTSGEVNEDYQAYATRKGQSLEKFRQGGGSINTESTNQTHYDLDAVRNVRSSKSIPSWGEYVKEEGDTDEEDLDYLEDTFADMDI